MVWKPVGFERFMRCKDRHFCHLYVSGKLCIPCKKRFDGYQTDSDRALGRKYRKKQKKATSQRDIAFSVFVDARQN